jgi:hypothetical protein
MNHEHVKELDALVWNLLDEKQKLGVAILRIDGELTKLPKTHYNHLRRDRLIDEKASVIARIGEIRREVAKTRQERNAAERGRVKTSRQELILNLRQKYMDFASDHTRVSSMRQMAAQFALELENIQHSY